MSLKATARVTVFRWLGRNDDGILGNATGIDDTYDSSQLIAQAYRADETRDQTKMSQVSGRATPTLSARPDPQRMFRLRCASLPRLRERLDTRPGWEGRTK